MILQNRFLPSVSKKSLLVIVLLALLVLPSLIQIGASPALAVSKEESPAAPLDTGFLAQRFKHRVEFETGRTQINGGKIEIREVWGTRPTIEVGGQYLVRGKYALPAGQRGRLYFYASASGPWGKTASLDLQSTVLDQQEGEFALVHGMAGPGFFHLILTDVNSYSNWFADTYFGTGDNVYRVAPATAAASSGGNVDLPFTVKFEEGQTKFLEGDNIKITEVRGTADTFAPGNLYWIKGTYTLASHDHATLAAHVTAMDVENAKSASLKLQHTAVDHGDGTFTLCLPMLYRGWPHVSFYPTDGDEAFGGNYFGTGDSPRKELGELKATP